MAAAEAGADYVMFGEPDADGVRPSFDAISNASPGGRKCSKRPASPYAASLDEIAPLVEAGADFIALGAAAIVLARPRQNRGDACRLRPASQAAGSDAA